MCFLNVLTHFLSLQLRFEGIWSSLIGRAVGQPLELILRKNEHFTQVSKKEISRSFVQYWALTFNCEST